MLMVLRLQDVSESPAELVETPRTGLLLQRGRSSKSAAGPANVYGSNRLPDDAKTLVQGAQRTPHGAKTRPRRPV